MKRSAYISFLMVLLFSSLSLAQEQQKINITLENISGMYAECAAYYRLVYFALNMSNKKETANAYRQLEDSAMLLSLLLAKEGRSEDMAAKVTGSRIEINMKQMKQEIDNRNENISILINKYQSNCTEAVTNPPDQVLKILKARAGETNK